MWKPMPGLFGAYLANPDSDPGILVNSRLTRAVRRQSAAHELGHHRLGHSTSFDYSAGEDPARALGTAVRRWTPEEKAAEAFAAWFLMPRRAVLATLADLALPQIMRASQVYQLALHLGTGYATTVRHLVSLRLLTAEDAEAWARIPPARFKRDLAGALLDSTRDVDVWHLGRGQLRTLHTSPDDLLLVPSDTQVLGTDGAVTPLTDEHQGQLLRCEAAVEEPSVATIHTRTADIAIVVEPRPYGIDRSSLP